MHIAEVTFRLAAETDDEKAVEAIDRWTSALRQNGQALGREMPLALKDEVYRTWLMTPAADSLDPGHNNKWVECANQLCEKTGLIERRVDHMGAPYETVPCVCDGRNSLILYTNHVALESCVRCGDCFDPVPLYAVPPTYDDSEYYDLLWQSDYQACDQLQMGCSTGERFALREMGRVDSSLTKRGREICRKIEASTGKPYYYFLYRYYGRSARFERERRCRPCTTASPGPSARGESGVQVDAAGSPARREPASSRPRSTTAPKGPPRS